jgi:hypothetical protein
MTGPWDPALIAKTAKEVGMKVRLAAGGLGNEYSCLNVDAQAMERCYAVHDVAARSETGIEGIKLIQEYFTKNKRPASFRTTILMRSWNTVLVFKKIVENIVDQYGWEKLTGPMIKKQFESMEDFSPLGPGVFCYMEK